ncbi:hypothetical protein ES288_D07G003200v1 [Gossypium darwinii]|uniref:RING-type E3 ubiquitin transferase n=1 Tax=Gossypium darwinii TaxID=34276 RepID=A0A5D2BTX9_GOSDA|nr:hypothetical protein ES288_D07G003200v1 [Gossypium darwinii]
MKVQLFVVLLWIFVELPVLITGFLPPCETDPAVLDSLVVIAYNRSTDIEKHCSFLLTSASELIPDVNRGSRLKNELSFYLGEWEQKTDEAPLIQFDDNGNLESSQPPISLLKLASFEVKDVNSIQQLRNTVSLGGILSVGISRDWSFAYGGKEPRRNPGSLVVKIVFEGVYMETEENGGERLMCLVGSSTSTLPCTNTCDCDEFSELQTGHVTAYDYRRICFLQDDLVLLVLRYPKIFNLTQRAISGEMTSLNEQGGQRYFSKVHISSQLSGHSKYQFSSELVQSTTFDPPPYKDEQMEDGFHMFTGREFCRLLDHEDREIFLSNIPNYRFNSSYKNQIHGKLGPFVLEKEIQATSISRLDEVKLIFQHVKCEQDTNRTGSAKVTAVLRSVTKTSFQRLERLRTGLSGSTLAVEGIWNSSSGQLSMVGCQETVDSGPEGCDYVISMYFPRSFSIKQRSFLFGTISNVKKDTGLDNPLYFSAMQGINTRDFTEYLSYNYSVIKLVNAFERRTIPYQILSIAKKWLFKYPALKDAEEPLAQLNRLTRKLASDGSVVVPDDQLIAGPKSRVLVQIKVLSVGPLLVEGNLRNKTVITKDELASCRFWNVSMHLAFKTEKELKQTTYKDVSELSLEGVYDPSLGEMHLVGCRKALIESMGIERGQDCLISVKIQYPPLNLKLWKKPTAKITINSQRKVGDPLYFNLINIHVHLSYYLDYFEADTQQAYFEAIVGSLLLTMSIAIIWNQLLYMKVNADIVPYISTTMLAFQFLGYSLPLICNAKVVLKSMVPKGYDWPPPANGMLKFIQSFEQALLMVMLLLIARLVHMVIKSRSKTMSEGSFKLRHAPREKRVMLTTMAIYASGVLILLDSVDKQNGLWQTWRDVMVYLVFVFQDFFLIPQVIRNTVMGMPVKCLREGYYLGLTTVRLLVLYFDYLMDPTIYTRVGRFDFSSLSSTCLTLSPVAAPVIYAIIVYIQQNNQKHRSLQRCAKFWLVQPELIKMSRCNQYIPKFMLVRKSKVVVPV